jgi:PhnB protein
VEIAPYLIFNGNCRTAFSFYEQLLGGKIEFSMTHGESPMAAQTPAEAKDKILHIRMSVRGQTLMGSDAHGGRYDKPQGTWISLSVDSAGEGERIFKALSENGSAVMPFQKTFWAEGFGMCVDRFGTPWMVNAENKNPRS